MEFICRVQLLIILLLFILKCVTSFLDAPKNTGF